MQPLARELETLKHLVYSPITRPPRALLAAAGVSRDLGITDRLFAHLQRLHVAYHDTQQTGQLMSRANTDLQQIQNAVVLVPLTIANLATVTDTVAALLVALPLFADLSAERVRSLARESVIVPLRLGHDLPLPSPSDASVAAPLWVIVEGQVHLTVAGIPVGGTLGPGDFVGELSAYYESACLFRAEVTAEGRALCVAPTVLQSLAGQYQGLRTALEESAWERAFEALGHASALLAAIEPAMRAGLYARFEPVQFAAGDSLLTEGEPAAWVWLIAAGSVERYGGALGAKVQRAGAGSAVGVASAWEANPSGVSVRARRTTLAARVSAAACLATTSARSSSPASIRCSTARRNHVRAPSRSPFA